jgi:membrane protein required for colicin V production
MFDLTVLDYVFVGVILASTIWATIRGGVYETIATLSWVVAAISARFASPWLDKMLQSWFDLTESTVGTLVASYFIVFFAVLILVGFLNQKLRDKIQASIMNVTDKTLGVIFGIVRVIGICVPFSKHL